MIKSIAILTIVLVNLTTLNAQKKTNYAKLGLGFNALAGESGSYKTGINILASDYIGITNKSSIALTASYNSAPTGASL